MSRDDYQWWRDALAGVTGEVHDGRPQPGFYRRREVKDGPWLPVAIWRNEVGKIECVVGAEWLQADPDATWLACARHPVAEADYRTACETGTWPGDAAATPAAASNNPPPDAASLAQRIAEATSAAAAWLDGRKIISQADADKCEKLANDLTKLAKDGDTERDREVRPHLEAQREVNGRWKPIIDAAQAQVRAIKAALTPYLNARAAEKREAAAKAVAAGAEPVRADTKATTSGLSGRRVSMRTRRVAVINDYDAALAFFKDHPDIKALVQKLADKVASIEGKVPGVEIKTEQVAA